jgi:hypothetical protein
MVFRAFARLPCRPSSLLQAAAAIEVAAQTVDDHSIDAGQFEPLEQYGYIYRIEPFPQVLPELLGLHALHFAETERYRHHQGLAPDYDAMRIDWLRGALLQFTVRHQDDGALVGNLRLYVRKSRHTGALVATEDTLFMHPDHRQGLKSITLLRYAEQCLRRLGVVEVRADSKLAAQRPNGKHSASSLMRRLGYEPVSIQHVKILEA